MKCFYHNDPDGWCSAFWVRKYLEREGIPFTREDFIEMNYDKEFPMDIISEGEQVFIVDFSIDPDQMFTLISKTHCSPVWIDHHKSAIERYDGYTCPNGNNIAGIRWDGIAACALTWSYFFHELIDDPFYAWDKLHTPDEIMQGIPLFTQYIHLWDTWQWKRECYQEQLAIECFITYLTSLNPHPLDEVWDKLSTDRSNELYNAVDRGVHMLDFRNGYAAGLCKDISKVIEFEGHRCLVCNMGHVSSEWFKSVEPSTYDILMPFYYSMQSNQFIFSLYCSNPDIDVSKIAVKYGGGGHKGAAGFQCKDLPFKN